MANCIGKRELVEGKHRRGLTIAVEQHQRLRERLDVCAGIAVDLLLALLLPARVRVAAVFARHFPQPLAVDEQPPFECCVQRAPAARLVQRSRDYTFAGRGVPFPVFPVQRFVQRLDFVR